MGTNKRQLSFYPEEDIDLYLDLLGSGTKTRTIIEALRKQMEDRSQVDVLGRARKFLNIIPRWRDELTAYIGQGNPRCPGVDAHIWTIVQETAGADKQRNVARYLALHELKSGRPLKVDDREVHPDEHEVKPLVDFEKLKETQESNVHAWRKATQKLHSSGDYPLLESTVFVCVKCGDIAETPNKSVCVPED